MGKDMMKKLIELSGFVFNHCWTLVLFIATLILLGGRNLGRNRVIFMDGP